MRKTLFALISLIVGTAAHPESLVYDRDLAIAAGKAYVEAYWRVHLALAPIVLAWDRVDLVAVSTPGQTRQDGVVGVFFPESVGPGVGFACFAAVGGPDHLIPTSWGRSGNIEKAIKSFRLHAKETQCISDDGFF